MYTKTKDNIRKMVNAGINYPKDKNDLSQIIQIWLNSSKIDVNEIDNIKGLFIPTSNFSESGLTSSWAFNYLNIIQNNITYFIFIPISKINISDIAISNAKFFETPLGYVEVNQKIISELKENNPEILNADLDYEESEETVEANIMFLKYIHQEYFKIIPVYVGNLNNDKIKKYGKIFSKYLDNENIKFIICSDLIYWGEKYNFNWFDNKKLEIFENIEILDKEILKFIEKLEYDKLNDFLKEKNLNLFGIKCILLFIQLIKNLKFKFEIKFLRYSQNYNVTKINESSKSFASGIFYLKN